MRFHIITLGCKVNQYETQAIETMLVEKGHAPSDIPTADAVIVNSCAVTAESGRKTRSTIRRAKAANPGAVLAVAGCFSQLTPDDAARLGADVIFGSGERRGLVDAVEAAVSERGAKILNVPEARSRKEFETLPPGAVSGRTRALIKIEDGCDNFCSYCVIPHARGGVRSLTPGEAGEMAARLQDEGFGEIVLTGIEISSYGKDLESGETLIDAVEAVSGSAPGVRLRLGSLEPTIVTEEFCARLAGLGNICGHFHLSLQSGCDRTLLSMRRKYDTATFRRAAESLRAAFPNCALTADLIVGHPGETDEDHAESLEFLKDCAFAQVHVFPYSRREGTVSAKMPQQVSKAVKEKRALEARLLAGALKKEFLASQLGRVLPVLFETEKDGWSYGHAENYAEVRAQLGGLRGRIADMRITGASDEILIGEICK